MGWIRRSRAHPSSSPTNSNSSAVLIARNPNLPRWLPSPEHSHAGHDGLNWRLVRMVYRIDLTVNRGSLYCQNPHLRREYLTELLSELSTAVSHCPIIFRQLLLKL